MKTIEDIIEALPEARRAKVQARVEYLRDFQKKLICLHADYARFADATPGKTDAALRIADTWAVVEGVPDPLVPILFDIALYDPAKAKQIMQSLGDLQALVDQQGVTAVTKLIYDARHAQPNEWDRTRAHIARMT